MGLSRPWVETECEWQGEIATIDPEGECEQLGEQMGVTRMSIGEWPGKIVTIDLEGECEQLGEWMGVTSMSIGKTVLKVKVKAKNMRTTGSRQDWSWKQTQAMTESDDAGSQTWKAHWAHDKEKDTKRAYYLLRLP